MKSVTLNVLLLGFLVSIGCSKEEEEVVLKACTTCELMAQETMTTTGLCDNGDGTVELSVNDQTETIEDLEGMSAEEYIEATAVGLEFFGATCNRN